MADLLLQDPRLTLIGAGFLGDSEAQDGVHLRWSFDPDLGFPAEGFRLWVRDASREDSRKVSFTKLATQLEQHPAAAGIATGVTVHRMDGGRIAAGRRCDQIGLALGSAPLVLRFRPGFGAAPEPVRSVTVFGLSQRGAVSVRARHAGRVADCAAVGAAPCLRDLTGGAIAEELTALTGADMMLAGRDLRTRRSGDGVAAAVREDRASALERLRDVGFAAAAASCTPFQLTVRADAIDEVLVSGCDAILVGALWSPIAPDDAERGWTPLAGPICLPVDDTPGSPCTAGASGRAVASARLPDAADLPPGAPTRAELDARLLGADFDELSTSLEKVLSGGGQFVTRLAADDIDDGTTWRYDVVRDAVTAAADPYFARILGLYWVHHPIDATARHDYRVEATWPIDGEKKSLSWIIYDRGLEAQPPLPPPTATAATPRIGAAHVMADGILNPFEMDVTVDWRRPSVCELADPVRSPIAYLIERTAADDPATGPYRLVTRRTFEAGGVPEVVPVVIADPDDGAPRFSEGYFVDRGPGYGTFHYRVLGRDIFGRTSGPSAAASVLVTDQVAPGPPLNLAAEYVDPADPDRAGSEMLAWANRDATVGAQQRAAIVVRWVWPEARRMQFPDLDEFRLYFRPGSLNHVLGRITDVAEVAPGEYTVRTDIAPIGPDFPVPQAGIDLGALRSEGEECTIVTVTTESGRLVFRVRANAAAPPLIGPCTFRLGRGRSATATQQARAPYPAFRSFEQPPHWEGFIVGPATPPRPLRVGADGVLRGPVPAGLTLDDILVDRVLEPVDGQVHWHYRMLLRGVELVPTRDRPRAVGTFGIGSVDLVGNEGRIAPPASIVALHRVPPPVPVIVYPPVNFATRADYHGASWFTLEWTGVPDVGYQVFRAGDLDLLAAAGIEVADHRAATDDEQRLQLQQLALDPANIEAFRLVTAAPLLGTGGPMQHRDALPGSLRNRFVYRIRSIDQAGNLAPWPPATAATCVVVDLPGVPPAPPAWAEVAYPPSGGVTLRWTPNASVDIRGYRLYRADEADAADDVRSMSPLFTAAQDEGGGTVVGTMVDRDAAGAIVSVTELAPGDRRPGRLLQHVDTTARPGRPLYYRLVAEDAAGNRSAASERLVVQLPTLVPPAPPAWAAPTVTAGSIGLRWSAEEGVDSLVLRRADGGLWRALRPWAPPGADAFDDTDVAAGTLYEYRVRIRDRVGHIVDGPVLPVTAI
ncbi:hypothetical protein SAMN04487846_1056 [Microbacterium sp. cf046]|uniref:fibronectin type III domain-containing protein n=1 Tax=Microbacterium sp. cf046 TaxID=1761803 RepID=UPI0008E955D0|nr:hypothetical protein [Microbacterium sp. cf046]SFR94938.1 hypothetical protein SAMN04487846_1056 [Microbacterium sp. cf046]